MPDITAEIHALYNAGRFSEALRAAAPHVRDDADPGFQLLLLVGQSALKVERYGDAARYFSRAADRDPARASMLRGLAAEALARADLAADALSAARQNVRRGSFDPMAMSSYRTMLQDNLCLDEQLIENQFFLDQVRRGDTRYLAAEHPLSNISWCDDESINMRMRYGSDKGLAFDEIRSRARRTMAHSWGEPIRIGYLSNDFSSVHPTMMLLRGVLTGHDAARFDIRLFCYTPQDLIARDDGLRQTLPPIHPIGHLSDEAAADLIRTHNIDILVDLKGHTKGSRWGIVNHGCAPVQVAYLGYPGSGTGIDCDYVIGDHIVLPDSSKPFYDEKFCRLPDTYQPNDNSSRPHPAPLSRAAAGLNATGLVFAAFHAPRKITPRTAELWADILNRVPDSLLWTLGASALARKNLIGWMADHGVVKERIVFAEPLENAAHLARLPCADIGLDCFPYNGHTSTSDALWMGLPVATFPGGHFASRVSASLLNALDMPDLIAADARAYVDLVVRLAQDDAWRAEIRARIARHRTTSALFDTARFTRHLEMAFVTMVDRARAGQEPAHFDIPAV